MDSQVNTTTLDHIQSIKVEGDVFKEPKNEYWSLICLFEGMELLYHNAKKCNDLVELNSPESFLFGNAPELKNVPKAILTSYLHWYAVSASNYVRTVGAIAGEKQLIDCKPLDYARKIIPEVITYRDKVAAHFSWSTKNNKDNSAERMVGVIPQLTYHNNTFHVGQMSFVNGNDNSDEIKPWSITETHIELKKRYWPEVQ